MIRRLAITPGEPAGIGPDLLLQYIQQGSEHELVAFADPELLNERARALNLPLHIRPPSPSPQALGCAELCVQPIKLKRKVRPGVLDTANASYVLACLDQAINSCLAGLSAALITGPVQKSVINDAGIPFSGHTEYLAEKTGTKRVVMMLANDTLRVALVTTHLPLRDVPDAITPKLLEEIIEILHSDLKTRFGFAAPRILVSGLNPHAGEAGHLGREEIEVITPVLEKMRAEGYLLSGPLPADTLFTEKYLAQADAVLAMYHDQGLPVLKYQGFGQSANITLGLPIIRTSVDHGTALELAGTGLGDCGSLKTAIDVALQMTSAPT